MYVLWFVVMVAEKRTVVDEEGDVGVRDEISHLFRSRVRGHDDDGI